MLRPNESPAVLDRILPQFAESGRGEFLQSPVDRKRTPALLASAVWHGYLPMGTSSSSRTVLLKIHRERCLLKDPGSVHIGKKSRKLARKFRLSVNEDFPQVVRNIQEHTWSFSPGDCWLVGELPNLYSAVNQLPGSERRGVRFHSVELWHKESGRLVAGEVGYTLGGVYTSATGFALKDEFPGSGTLQLALLGRWLERCGFDLWDLGMSMDYKRELGARDVPRKDWLACVRALRDKQSADLLSPAASLSSNELLLEREQAGSCGIASAATGTGGLAIIEDNEEAKLRKALELERQGPVTAEAEEYADYLKDEEFRRRQQMATQTPHRGSAGPESLSGGTPAEKAMAVLEAARGKLSRLLFSSSREPQERVASAA